jgi:hypothetical protein
LRNLTLLPGTPMKRFGINPFDEPLYRVIFSDSRTDMVGGCWPDGVKEYREVPRYPDIHSWILEKWMSGMDYAGTKEAYEASQLDVASNLYTCGPYPSRGEYQICYVFPHQPGDGMIVQIITAIKLSRDVHPAHQKQAYADAYAQQARDKDNRMDAIVDDAMGAFSRASAVVSAAQGPKGTRQGWKRSADMPLERWGQSAPLPTRDNYFGTIIDKAKINALTGESQNDSHAS